MLLVVTQTFAPATGGMETYMTGLAEHLSYAGYEVTVLADGHPVPLTAQTPYHLQRFCGMRPWRRWKKRRAVTKLAATGAIEGIFCDSWKSILSLPQDITAPIAVLAHGTEYPPMPSSSKRKRIVAALSRASVIIANSRFTADKVHAFLPLVNDERLMVILPPASDLKDPSFSKQNEIRALIGDGTPVLSTLARLEPRKGIDRVIAALPDLIARHPHIVFLIGGDGDDKKRLQTLADQKGVTSHVLFYGWVTDTDTKAAILSQSDVFVMPSYRVGASVEGFGISYIEAAWFGVPALGSKGSGAEDAIIDGKTGLLCTADDQDDVTSKLITLLEDDALRHRMGQAAQARARHELAWKATLPHFLAALKISERKTA